MNKVTNPLDILNRAPDSSKIKAKMVYSTSKDALRRGLVGVQIDVQATDHDEISYESGTCPPYSHKNIILILILNHPR